MLIWSDFEFVIHLACIIKPRILDIIWPCLLIIMIIWKKCCMQCGVWNQMKIWSSHLLDNLSNCLVNLKNSGDSTRFKPMASAMPVQCSNQMSYEVTQWRAGVGYSQPRGHVSSLSRSIWRWAFCASVISLNSKAFNSAE